MVETSTTVKKIMTDKVCYSKFPEHIYNFFELFSNIFFCLRPVKHIMDIMKRLNVFKGNKIVKLIYESPSLLTNRWDPIFGPVWYYLNMELICGVRITEHLKICFEKSPIFIGIGIFCFAPA